MCIAIFPLTFLQQASFFDDFLHLGPAIDFGDDQNWLNGSKRLHIFHCAFYVFVAAWIIRLLMEVELLNLPNCHNFRCADRGCWVVDENFR